ncbi:MAG: tetratricopeptide repeat protein [Saprospiraceae bacterium]|nr:tetratricopeptide repeat protein [Saprospiraceae bacterium]
MNHTEFARQLSHVDVLLSQGRFAHAEAILERLLATDYETSSVMKLMTVAKMGLGKYKDAEELCQTIISLHPDDSFLFYIMASIRGTERKFSEAKSFIKEAISMEPANAAYHAYLSNICLQTKEFTEALHAADTGLSIDAENIDALNARSSALVSLGRKEEAFQTIEKSLATDPNNSDTHANMGWGLLHHGKTDDALKHFKEALKENPMSEYARNGMLEAMKSRFPVYRYFLMLMLWLSKLNNKNQWVLIIGGFVIYRILLRMANSFEYLQPYLIPVIVLLAMFFLSTWIFSPLMNLYLLTNPFGKLTLNQEQKQSARWVGLALGLSILSLMIYLFITQNEGFLSLSVLSFAMMIPLGSMNRPIVSENRKKLKMATIVLAIFVCIDSIMAIFLNNFMSQLFFLPVMGLIAYQWYANFVLIKE